MRPAGVVKFTVDGRPFHVRRDQIMAAGEGVRPLLDEAGQPTEETEIVVLITVSEMGNIPVAETLDEVLTIWEGLG